MDESEARRLGETWVAAMDTAGRFEPVVTMVERISRTWVVYWNNRSFVETGDMMHALGGNAPLLIADDGRTGVSGTALPTEHYVRDFEAESPN